MYLIEKNPTNRFRTSICAKLLVGQIAKRVKMWKVHNADVSKIPMGQITESNKMSKVKKADT